MSEMICKLGHTIPKDLTQCRDLDCSHYKSNTKHGFCLNLIPYIPEYECTDDAECPHRINKNGCRWSGSCSHKQPKKPTTCAKCNQLIKSDFLAHLISCTGKPKEPDNVVVEKHEPQGLELPEFKG